LRGGGGGGQITSIIVCQVKRVSFKPRFKKTVNEELSNTVLGSEFQTVGAE